MISPFMRDTGVQADFQPSFGDANDWLSGDEPAYALYALQLNCYWVEGVEAGSTTSPGDNPGLEVLE